MKRMIIKDFYGRMLGTIEQYANGDETGKDFYGRVVARYDKSKGITTDFYGRMVATGNVVSSFIFTPNK